MATNTKAPKKTARASKKAPAHETHGALPPAQEQPRSTNWMKAFGIKDEYGMCETLADYEAELDKLSDSEMHDHAHNVGVVPLDPRPKLMETLKRKFTQSKMAQRTRPPSKVAINPAMADWHAQYTKNVIGR